MSEQSDRRDLGLEDGHHTPEQVDKAFAYAPTILRKLSEAGVPLPSLELFADASGRLHLGNTNNKITNKQYKLAEDLLYTTRPYETFCDRCFAGEDPAEHTHEIGLTFCCGLVTAAEEAES